MRKNKKRVGSLILGALLSFTIFSCEKERIETVTGAGQIETDDVNDCTLDEVTLDLRGTWNWESTETLEGIVTSEESEDTKKVYFKEDLAYFYTNDKIVKSRTYGLYQSQVEDGVEAIILVIEGDDFTYEVSVSDEDVLTIYSQDCTDPSIVKYRKK